MTLTVSWPLLLARICWRKSPATLSPRKLLFSFLWEVFGAAYVKSSSRMPLTRVSSNEKLVNQAIARDRFVLFINITSVTVSVSSRSGGQPELVAVSFAEAVPNGLMKVQVVQPE